MGLRLINREMPCCYTIFAPHALQVYGCTNSEAINYKASAVQEYPSAEIAQAPSKGCKMPTAGCERQFGR